MNESTKLEIIMEAANDMVAAAGRRMERTGSCPFCATYSEISDVINDPSRHEPGCEYRQYYEAVAAIG